MKGLASILAERLQYQYLFGAALWLIWLGQLVLNGGIYVPNGLQFGIDYVAFYSAGRMVLTGHSAELYDPKSIQAVQRELYDANPESIMEFLNPPYFALFLAPFAGLDFPPSLLVWTAFSLAVLALGLVGLEGKLQLGTLATVLCFFPIFSAIKNGQNSLLTAGLFGIVYGLLRQNRLFLAGLAASLILYKPHLLLGLGMLWLVQVRRHWPALLGLACGGAILLAVTWLVMPQALTEFTKLSQEKLVHWIYRADYHVQIQHTIRGLVLTLLPGQRGLAETAQVAVIVLGLLALTVFARRQPALPLSFAAAVLIGACISPYLLIYDWAVLIVPGILLWRHAAPGNELWVLPLAAVWLAALTGRFLIEQQLALFSVAVHVPYVVLVGATAVSLWWCLTVPAPESVPAAARG